MKIKITQGFCLGAGRDVFPGDVVDVSEQDAILHIGKGRAVEAKPGEAEPKTKASKTNGGSNEA